MIHLTCNTRVFLSVQPVDFRRQIDGLICWCKYQLKENPRSGALFVFRNRSSTMIRILHYDGSGYWLATKRLSQEFFRDWPKGTEGLTDVATSRLMQIIKSGTCEERLN